MFTYLKLVDITKERLALNCNTFTMFSVASGILLHFKTNAKNMIWIRSGKHTHPPTRNRSALFCKKQLFNKSQWSREGKLKQSNVKDNVRVQHCYTHSSVLHHTHLTQQGHTHSQWQTYAERYCNTVNQGFPHGMTEKLWNSWKKCMNG